MILSDLHHCHDLELQSFAGTRQLVAGTTAGGLSGGSRPDPEELSSKRTLSLEMLLVLGEEPSLPCVTAQTAKVCLPMADSKELTYISSLKSEYSLKGSLALRQLHGYTASGQTLH